MNIKLNKPFAANSAVDEFDVRQMKKALNRLGYYQPYEKTGITGIPDAAVFSALKSFQKDQGLQLTGTVRPGDETISKLSSEAGKKKSGIYIWRTVGDNKVRDSHAALGGTIRDLADSPDPGEEFNCRCWAEFSTPEGLQQDLISKVNDSEKWADVQFLLHFAIGFGRTVTLEEIGYLADVIAKAREIMFKNVEDQVADKMREVQSGSLTYTTEESYYFGDVHPYFGGGTIRTKTQGKVTKQDDILSIQGTVEYEYEDTFTDPQNIRQEKYGTSSPEGIPYWELKITDRGGTYYKIVGSWKTHLTGSIKINKNG